ncbi:MAG: glutaredoxin family protein [Chloroflexi bacterium]|nr:glutaredoxin family protein [Chloroflexota bacterium]
MKEFLSRRGVQYGERDVLDDPAAMDELVRLGVLTTPVTTIDGQTIIGFDEKKLEEALKD